MNKSTGHHLTPLVVLAAAVTFGGYFSFAAIQGDYGLFRRAEIIDDAQKLQVERDALNAEVVRLENLTKRLSDDYLDLDLLDAQARDVLGLMRADEIIIR
ncbi:MAG: septum formation initiator family protein [Marinovum sp.]|nr:septum formation initiator family protein [Marinovum sp.]